MTQRTSFSAFHCSLARSLDVIGEWWTPLIVSRVGLGLTRFDDLRRELGVSTKVLAERLEALVASGVLERRRYQDRPARDEYLLTAKGADLIPALVTLMAWGDRWTSRVSGPPLLLRHRSCGHDTEPVITCSHCGERLEHTNLEARTGPGARIAPGTLLTAERLAGEGRAPSSGHV